MSDEPRGVKRRFQLSRKLAVEWFVTGDPPDIAYRFHPVPPKRPLTAPELRAYRRSRLEAAAMLSQLHPDNPVVHVIEGAGPPPVLH